MEERRCEPRIKVAASGLVSLDGRTLVPCQIHDLSETGIRLIMETTAGVPKVFLLHARGYGSGICEVAWRTETMIGGHLTRVSAW